MDDAIELLEHLQNLDFTYPELSDSDGWHDAAETKSQIESFLEKLIGYFEEYSDSIDSGVIAKESKSISSVCKLIQSQIDTVGKLVSAGTNNEKYPSQRDAITSRLSTYKEQLETDSHPLLLAIRVARIEAALSQEEDIETIRLNAKTNSENLISRSKEADDLIEKIRGQLVVSASYKAQSRFSSLSSNHKAQASRWFVAFVIASIVATMVALWVFTTPFMVNDPLSSAVDLVKRALLLALVFAFIKLTLSKYNVERNLHIVYVHRDAVLDQYSIFESAIGENDLEIKNQFRLEIAKVVFTDPGTGYVAGGSSSELNINPVIGMIENVTKSKP